VKVPHGAVGFDTHTQSFFGEAKETKPFEEKNASPRSCFSLRPQHYGYCGLKNNSRLRRPAFSSGPAARSYSAASS